MNSKSLLLVILCMNPCAALDGLSIDVSTTPEKSQFVFSGEGIVLTEYSRGLADWQRLVTDPTIFLLNSVRYTLKDDDAEKGIFVRAYEIDPEELTGTWRAMREIVQSDDCEFEGELSEEFDCEIIVTGFGGIFWSIQIQRSSGNIEGSLLYMYGPINKDGSMVLSRSVPTVCDGALEIVSSVGEGYLSASEEQFEITLIAQEPHCEGAPCVFESIHQFTKIR